MQESIGYFEKILRHNVELVVFKKPNGRAKEYRLDTALYQKSFFRRDEIGASRTGRRYVSSTPARIKELVERPSNSFPSCSLPRR